MTSHKRDSAEPGNAYMAYIPDATAPPADGGKPKLHTMEDIENTSGLKFPYMAMPWPEAVETKVTITPAVTASVVYVPIRDESRSMFAQCPRQLVTIPGRSCEWQLE